MLNYDIISKQLPRASKIWALLVWRSSWNSNFFEPSALSTDAWMDNSQVQLVKGDWIKMQGGGG